MTRRPGNTIADCALGLVYLYASRNLTLQKQTMSRRFLIVIAAALLPAVAHSQDSTKPKPDSSMKSGSMDDHMMGPWKEMNAFHRVMGATWHPASHTNDLKPLRARAKELFTAAETWAGSKPPSMPASCGSEPVRGAVAKVVTETKALLALLDSGADDTRLKAALKTVHDTFEVAEKGCAGHGMHG